MVTRSCSPIPFDQPNFVLKRNEKGKNSLTLFQLIQTSSWADAANYIHENPSEAADWIVKPECDETEWRRLPLHEACIRLPPVEFIEILIKAHPRAIEEADHNGRLPIHHACCHGASLEVVEKLILLAPRTLDVRDVWGKDPLSVAKGAIGSNRDFIIATLSKGSEFYRDMILKSEWAKEHEAAQYAQEAEYQTRIQMQEKQISQLIHSIQDESEQYEFVKRRQRDTITRLQVELSKEKEKFMQTILSLKSDLDSKQSTIEELNSIIEEKDQRIGELEERLQQLNVDLDREVSITDDLKVFLSTKKQEVEALSTALEVERRRGESLKSIVSDLTQRVSTQSIELKRLQQSSDDRKSTFEQEIASLQKNTDEVQKRCVDLAAKEVQLKSVIESLTAKLNLSNADNTQILGRLTSLSLEYDTIEKKLKDKEREAQSLSESTKSIVEVLKLRNAELEGETGVLLKKVELLEKDAKTLEMKCSFLDSHMTEYIDSEACLKEMVDKANSQVIALRKKVAVEERNVTKIAAALEDEKRQNEILYHKLEQSEEAYRKLQVVVENLQTAAQQAKQRDAEDDKSVTKQLHDTRINYDKILHELKKERSELEFKVMNLEATIRHMKKEREEEERSRNLAFASFEATMKKAGDEHLMLLNTMIVNTAK